MRFPAIDKPQGFKKVDKVKSEKEPETAISKSAIPESPNHSGQHDGSGSLHVTRSNSLYLRHLGKLAVLHSKWTMKCSYCIYTCITFTCLGLLVAVTILYVVCLPVCLFVCLYIRVPVCYSYSAVHLSVFLWYVCTSVSMYVYLSVYVYIFCYTSLCSTFVHL